MILQIVFVSQLRLSQIDGGQRVGIITGIPPAEEHRLTFGVTTTDAVRIVQCRTCPSESIVRNDRHAIPEKPRAYIMRIDDENDDIYTTAVSFPG